MNEAELEIQFEQQIVLDRIAEEEADRQEATSE